MIEFFKFSFKFDRQNLVEDLSICQSSEWKLHFNQNDFTGKWSSFALRSISGKETDNLATPNANFQDTPTLQKCQYFKEVISFFDCPKEAIRLLSLSPKSYIREHKDPDGGYKDGFFRIHIPIQTNEKVVFRLNGNVLPMKASECWYADFNLPHFVSNEGENDRIHLVIDCIRNDWSDKLFAENGYDFEAEKSKKYDTKTKLLMIEQLALMNTETANKMIAQLKTEIIM